MALFEPGSPCPLCGLPMLETEDTIGFSHLASSNPLILPFDDGVVHRQCISAWDQRDEFVAAWNSEAGDLALIVTPTGEVCYAAGRPVLGDILFGATVGSLMGAVVGWACCWLVGEQDIVWSGGAIGALAGAFGGAAIGARHGVKRTDATSSEIGTTVCIAYALLPALLVLLGGIGLVRGRLAGHFMLGAAFAFPMSGLLIGGVLDRIYEGILKRR